MALVAPITILRPEDSDPADDPDCLAVEFEVSPTGSLIEIRYDGSY